MLKQKRHPYDLPWPLPLYRRMCTSRNAGVIGAGAAAVGYHNLPKPLQVILEECTANIPGLRNLSGSSKLLGSVLAFLTVYAAGKGVSRVRLALLKKLLSWQGWMINSRSFKTKVWGILVKLLEGPEPHDTYFYQSLIPKQPVPDLNETLDRWLSVAEQFLTEEEMRQTKQAVEEFRSNEGSKLQSHLLAKASKEQSWIYDYWIYGAYLSNRNSLAVNSNYYTASRQHPSKTSDQIERASNNIYAFAKLAELLRNKEYPAKTIMGSIPLCMGTYKHMFNTNRLPGVHIDQLDYKPDGRNVVIIRKGQYFNLEMYANDKRGKQKLLCPQEISIQLRRIIEAADELEEEKRARPPAVAALTGTARATWAENREILMRRNAATLSTVEQSLFLFCVDDQLPKDEHEFRKVALVGRGDDRWFDKSLTAVIFPDGFLATNNEHSFSDATVSISLEEAFASAASMIAYCEKYQSGRVVTSCNPPRDLPIPRRLVWDTTDLEDQIVQAQQELQSLNDALDVYCMQLPYGKGAMKKVRLSPDGYIQMGLLYGYYLTHNSIPKAYEPATGRLFLLGRTETIHPISQSAVAWVKAMCDASADDETRQKHLSDAVRYQTQFKLDATMGKACDRHLFALMCASRELGMDLPKIFADTAWYMPFKLSTSQTPNELYTQNPSDTMEWTSVGGGFGPSCVDGYGICYTVNGDDIVNVVITSWNTCPETGSQKLAQNITKAFEEMKMLLGRKA